MDKGQLRPATRARRVAGCQAGRGRATHSPPAAYPGTINLRVLENVITPRAPCNALAPKPPARLLWAAKESSLAGCQGLKEALGPKEASWCQSALIVNPVQGEAAPLPAPLCRVSWLALGTRSWHTAPDCRAGCASGWHGEGDYLHCGFDASHHCHIT